MTTEELEARRPVWIALSELFLDTDVRLAYVSIAETLAASAYSLAELRRILDDEVTPVLQGNLCQVAGEWCGFDEEWLVEQISARFGKRRWLPALVNLDNDWRVLTALVVRLRDFPDPAARARRLSAWRALMPLLLYRTRLAPGGGECLAKNEVAIFREELWPLLIDEVRRLARSQPEVYPDEATVEENWSRWSQR